MTRGEHKDKYFFFLGVYMRLYSFIAFVKKSHMLVLLEETFYLICVKSTSWSSVVLPLLFAEEKAEAQRESQTHSLTAFFQLCLKKAQGGFVGPAKTTKKNVF